MARQGTVVNALVDLQATGAEMLRGVQAYGLPLGWSLQLIEPTGVRSDQVWVRRDEVWLIGSAGARLLGKRLARCAAAVGLNVDPWPARWPRVMVDNRAAGRLAAEHLITQGVKRFTAFGVGDHRFFHERESAFRAVVEAAGLPYVEGPGRPYPGSTEGRIQRWVKGLPHPVGVLAGCDAWAKQLVFECRLCGVRVPEDVLIVGVDNWELACELTNPPMSSVIMPWQQVGFEAARMLHELMQQRVPAPVDPLKPLGVAVRRSTDFLLAPDQDVAQALRVIRDRYDQPLSVPGILREVASSRRGLERAFKQHVGRTIMRELRRVRVEHVKRLLALSSQDMAGIAAHTGFATAQKMAQAFRMETGQTPSAYRAEHRRQVK